MSPRNVNAVPTFPHARIVGRIVSGRPLDGRPRTDSTFLHRGTRALTTSGRATHWAHRAGWERAAFRVTVPFVLLSAPVGLFFARWWTVATLAVLVASWAVWTGWRAVSRLRRWRLHRTVLQPVHTALHRAVGVAATARPESWLTVPANYRTDPTKPLVVALPLDFDRQAHGESLVQAIVDRAGIAEPRVTWHMVGKNPTVEIGARPVPPNMVRLRDVADAIDALPATEIVLGMGAGNKIVSASLELDSPHIALSAPSNSGKSVAVRGMVAQQLMKGAMAVFLDVKLESHLWALGLPNAAVLTDIEDIHYGLIEFWKMVRQRQDAVKAAAFAGEPRPTFPRLWLVAEEMNMCRKMLSEYWTYLRAEADPAEQKKMPKLSPALNALAFVSFAGRSVQANAILVAQKLTAAATGDPSGAVRENTGIRYMIRPKTSTWKMLADGANMPKFLQGHKGRAHVVIDGNVTEIQGLYLEEKECYDMALSGDVVELPGQLRGNRGSEVTGGGHVRPGHEIEDEEPAEETDEVPWLTVPAAISAGLLDGNAESLQRALRRARNKDAATAPESRIGSDGLEYRADALVRWAASRPIAGRKQIAQNDNSNEPEMPCDEIEDAETGGKASGAGES